MREEATRYGKRVYYHDQDIPEVIHEAGVMFFEPYRGWRAWLRERSDPAGTFEIECRVSRRPVFRGQDHDLKALLAAFQSFLDRHRDQVDLPGFECHVHSPAPRP